MSENPENKLCRIRYGDNWFAREDAEDLLAQAVSDIRIRNNGKPIRNPKLGCLPFNLEYDMWNALNSVWLTSREWLALCRRGMPVSKVLIKQKDAYYFGYPPRPWVSVNNLVVSASKKLRKLP